MTITNFPTSVPAKRLAESITPSSSSFKLSDIAGWDGNDLTSADFGTKLYAAFRNSTGTQLEFMEVDPTTITSASSAITILLRGLKFNGDRTTEVTVNKLTWVKGDTIVHLGTDTPQLFQTLIEYIEGIAIAGTVDSSTTVKGVVEKSTQAEIDAGTATGGTGAPIAVVPDQLALSIYGTRLPSATQKDALVGTGTPSSSNKYVTLDSQTSAISTATAALVKFGGTGADGALTLTSGATNIDLGNVAVVTKNYTSISITGTGSLTFTNPNTNGTTVILKSQGAVTLTSSTAPMIVASGLGAAGGTGGSVGASSTQSGNTGSDAYGLAAFKNNAGVGAGAGPGAGGAAPSLSVQNALVKEISAKYPFVTPGAGGGGARAETGGGSTAVGGNGGRGGGSLIIECGGAFNFTTAAGISVGGAVGTDGSGTGGAFAAGGGGGGGGGNCFIFYSSLTANSGTITISGGAGTSNGAEAGGVITASGGGGGGSITAAGSTGSGPSITPSSMAGGAGATGLSLVASNTEFV